MIPFSPARPESAKPTYRTLGQTGLKATSLAFGGMTTSDPSVSERAADFGINLFDSARGYQNGNNARMVGAARVARGDPLYGANSAALSRRLTQKGVPVAAIKWALQNEGVDIAIVCMTSHDQSDVNFRGMAEPLTEKDEKLLTAQPAGISS